MPLPTYAFEGGMWAPCKRSGTAWCAGRIGGAAWRLRGHASAGWGALPHACVWAGGSGPGSASELDGGRERPAMARGLAVQRCTTAKLATCSFLASLGCDSSYVCVVGECASDGEEV